MRFQTPLVIVGSLLLSVASSADPAAGARNHARDFGVDAVGKGKGGPPYHPSPDIAVHQGSAHAIQGGGGDRPPPPPPPPCYPNCGDNASQDGGKPRPPPPPPPPPPCYPNCGTDAA